ncbi:hypothetical protein BCL80_101163 [Streptomyces avidinii]|nr:hypothetical protein BCL80_101163 [Streptomyces avidinii]SNX71889.1 hypothetical protein SAMN05421860_101163 [Streptomyces microflavus]
MTAMHGSLNFKAFEHVPLMWVWADFQAGECDRGAISLRAASVGQSFIEPLGIGIGVVCLKRLLAPVRVECGLELAQDGRRSDRRETYVPLKPFEESSLGEVRATYVSRIEAAFSPEEPCLGMESGGAKLIVDLDLGTEVPDKTVQRSAFRGTDVRGCQDSDRNTASMCRGERLFENAETVPFDEGAQEVNAVGRSQLGAKLEAKTRVLRRVGDERRIGQWCRWADCVHTGSFLLSHRK